MNKKINTAETLGYAHKKHSHNTTTLKILIICMILVGIFMFVELVGGILTNSIALISDAAHMFSDFLTFGLSIAGIQISKFHNNYKKTYGYTRFETLISLINALTLVFICIIISYEAIIRFVNPPEVKGLEMIPIAVIGLLVNIIIITIIVKFAGNNENQKK